ncbi:MAG: LemA family protein [Candidatus Diapherotrites archaeon]|nr:LemA family protein [Candidatus Diapherotrites archaeon]
MAVKFDAKLIAVIAIVIVLAIVFWFVGIYNTLISLDQNVNTKWANVETQYQRRVDLIPNLVSTVKAYTDYEGPLLTEITQLRSQWTSAEGTQAKVETANEMESTISKLLVVMENYPTLQANQNFLSLQDELAGTENRIAVERSRFNDAVRSYNTSILVFPNNIVAGMFGFGEKDYFEATTEGAENAPIVDFT